MMDTAVIEQVDFCGERRKASRLVVEWLDDQRRLVACEAYMKRRVCRMEPSEKGVGLKLWECSACGGRCPSHESPRYCPHCGAEVAK